MEDKLKIEVVEQGKGWAIIKIGNAENSIEFDEDGNIELVDNDNGTFSQEDSDKVQEMDAKIDELQDAVEDTIVSLKDIIEELEDYE